MADRDWQLRHTGYDRPGSALAERLAVVRQHVRAALDACPAGPLRAISVCAGQGRDLLDVLAAHPRGGDVAALLVEQDPVIADQARARARDLGLQRISVLTGEAALTDHYLEVAPAHLVLLCGVFGNVGDVDIQRTVVHCPGMCAPGGHVIWTRHRRPPDLVPVIGEWFAEQNFAPVAVTPAGLPYAVATHRYEGPVRPLVPGVKLFRFL